LYPGREERINHADTHFAEIGPIALALKTKNKLAGLPSIAELAAEPIAARVTIAASTAVMKPEQLWL
jgi:hypothetical protein